MATTKTVSRTRSRDVETCLLQAGDAVLRRDGAAGVTVRSVAAEAGVAPMGVYSRFGSKEGLVDALLIRALGEVQRAVAARGEADPVERMRASARRYRQWALEHPAHYQAIFLSGLGVASDDVTAHLMSVLDAGCANIEHAMARGALRAGDPAEIVSRFWCATHGAITFELHGLVVTDDADKNFEAVLDMVIQGLSGSPQPVAAPPGIGVIRE